MRLYKIVRFPWYGYVALILCLVAWICSWLRIEPFYRYTFFPLWLGYILFVDALNLHLQRTSLLKRMGIRYLLLFAISSLFWWIFEVLNIPVQNWHYHLDQSYSPWLYFVLASLSFSTVLPAVLETAELLLNIPALRPQLPADQAGPRLPGSVLLGVEFLGCACLLLPILLPHYCFGLIWLSVVLVLDPINNLIGRKSAIAHIAVGDWRFIVLPLAGLCCGFFWEMWNFYALPKWSYTVPFIGFWKIFEMPLLGYTGYLPFALELFALYQTVLWLLRWHEDYLIF
ncbi:hypothetical protein [Tengunoibacter tsumagoiensis]|uniref:Lycopene cyclase domain-containing protein n=1 Tax=Tengunoibacter tsumagoiensis TaxID=2014871 RepID=A0A401ZTS0_9CHLR|nr:hypothetical protein [Tengunoibacter tsumagoiensis]GCE10257.1 hypothetical protein KTT_01160 [Tengunoibacter tsumagoiensis]